LTPERAPRIRAAMPATSIWMEVETRTSAGFGRDLAMLEPNPQARAPAMARRMAGPKAVSIELPFTSTRVTPATPTAAPISRMGETLVRYRKKLKKAT